MTVPSPAAPNIPAGFTFLRQAIYTCGEITNTVAEYQHKKTGMEFVLLPGGTCQLGSPVSDKGRYADEKLHTAIISPFLIAKYPCTQAQWMKLIRDNPSMFKGPSRPVENISWDQCQEFCHKSGLALPTEAQWEYACRGGCSHAYCFGNDTAKLSEYAWYKDNANNETHPVGHRCPNAFGLYDTHGNVWEWCADFCDYKDNSVVTNTYVDGIIDPICRKGWARVIRGGSWNNVVRYCRSARRFCFEAGPRSPNLGVRFACKLRKSKDDSGEHARFPGADALG